MSEKPELVTLLVPVAPGGRDLAEFHRELCERFEALVPDCEFMYLLGGPDAAQVEAVRALQKADPERVRVLQFAPGAGEAAQLTAAVGRARGNTWFTLPARYETDLAEIEAMLRAIEGGADMAIGRRTAGGADASTRVQSRLFNRIISWAAGSRIHDVASATRAIRPEVLEQIPLYGDYHRYLPLLAERLGFSVVEVPARTHPRAHTPTIHRPRVYFTRALDIVSVLFISRFTRYPLRLFGGVGSLFAAVGGLLLGVIGVQRLLGTPLADRPMLVLATLLLGLGVQAFTIGLLGELILFFNARNVRDYRIVAIYDAHAPQVGTDDTGDQNSV